MILHPDFPIHRRHDGSIDYDFYRAEAARMRIEERRRLIRVARSQVLRAVGALTERASDLRVLPRGTPIQAK